jgi:hypothetical protein
MKPLIGLIVIVSWLLNSCKGKETNEIENNTISMVIDSVSVLKFAKGYTDLYIEILNFADSVNNLDTLKPLPSFLTAPLIDFNYNSKLVGAISSHGLGLSHSIRQLIFTRVVDCKNLEYVYNKLKEDSNFKVSPDSFIRENNLTKRDTIMCMAISNKEFVVNRLKELGCLNKQLVFSTTLKLE